MNRSPRSFRSAVPAQLFLAAVLWLGETAGWAGARLISDLNSGSNGSFPSNLTASATSLFLSAYTVNTGRELWKYTGGNIALAANINETVTDLGGGLVVGNDSVPDWLTEFNGQLFFSAFDPRRGGELWRYDGSRAIRVADISPDANDTVKASPNSSWPAQLTVFNNALFFTANSGTARANYELWKYDDNGVRQAANLHPDIGTDYSSYPTGLTLFNGGLYFMADDGANGYELWRHNGTDSVLLNLNPGGAESSSYPKHFTAFNNVLYFQAYDAAHGYELWKTDGTAATLVQDINPGTASSAPEFLTPFNGALYFRAADPTHGFELWRYDGTQATLAADINLSADSYPKNLTVFGNVLVFAADDGVHGWELWKYDGATASLVADLNPSGDSFPEQLTVLNGILYFVATTADAGYELWQYDGVNITLAADVNPGSGSSFPQFLTPYQGQLYFSAADDGSSNWELWTLTSDEAPSVSLTAPLAGSTFTTADTIALAATATDDGTVTKVEFFANGTLVGTATSSPYGVSVTLAPGSYTVTAQATDNAGASTTSAAVNITVTAANQAPTVTLTAPIAGSTFTTADTIAMSATATDDGTVTKVEFFANGTLVGTATSSPYSVSAALAPGSYALTAQATDNAGASTTSAAVNITVDPVVPVERPRIISIRKDLSSYHLNVTGTTGVPHVLESTHDFVEWTALSTNAPLNGQITFNDTPAPDQQKRFYRIVVR
jgi:ELWxxDGT repeat protein